MKRLAKYRRGPFILSLKTLVQELGAGRWVFYHHKPMHPSVIWNWPMKTVIERLALKSFRFAESIERN